MPQKFTDQEFEKVKDLVELKPKIDELVEAHRFRKLLWKTIRIWASYITAAIVGAYSIFEVIIKLIANLRQ